MIDLGPHAVFIVWSYVGVALVVLGLIGFVAVGSARTTARLKALEARGVRRRSSATP